MKKLTPELEEFRVKIEAVAKAYGLDCFDTIFEIITYDQINEIAALGGFPRRYKHWKFGMDYEKLSKSYEFGLSKIYEMVINTDPCYAYLMEGNSNLDQKLVMAHVYGHCDFFKNNVWFKKTNRKMVDAMANHAVRIDKYIDKYGYQQVEEFIDQCLSLENLIDRYGVFNERKSYVSEESARPNFNFKVQHEYMNQYINPKKTIKQQEKDYFEKKQNEAKYPLNPEKDVLFFLMHHAPLEDWQQDDLSIIRDEAYYFSPQGLTKVINEGWASYWHSKILTQKVMNDSEVIEFSMKHSGVMAMNPGSFNPYKIGIELFRDIEDRWNKGKFGREWTECTDIKEKNNWDKKLNLGMEKIFEVRKLYNDTGFIDEFLTEEFCVKHKFFVQKFNQETQKWEVDSTDFPAIKKQLLFMLTNFGQPIIWVENSNFQNRGELLLKHLHEGQDLQKEFMEQTLSNLFKIWKRPVSILTKIKDQDLVFRYDGITGLESITTET